MAGWVYRRWVKVKADEMLTGALFAALGVYLLWGFDLDSVLTGWAALKLYFGPTCFYAAFFWWKRWWEIRQGFHQWPDPQGRFYDEWMRLPTDRTEADYYVWLAERKGWQEPWRTWAKWDSEISRKQAAPWRD
jgi:hypothetical protein